jgi:hypothetical protein
VSKRPIQDKKRKRAAKLFRASLPRYFDLVDWLIVRGHAKTKREAKQLILDHRVKSASHTLGVVKARTPIINPINGKVMGAREEEVVDSRIPVERKSEIVILPAHEVA